MKHLSFVMVLSLLVACGGNGNGSSTPSERERGETRRSCGGSPAVKNFACVSPDKYILNTRRTDLPENIQINAVYRIDGEERRRVLADSCKTPGYPKIISTNTGSSIFYESYPIMITNTALEIIDRDTDCKGMSVIIETELNENNFHADRESYTVNIDLD